MIRSPLVIINGRVQELPLGDTLSIPTEEEMAYSKRIDFINDNLLYKGEALVGSSEASSVWRIRKVTIGLDGDISETWAEGTSNFDKAWSLRLNYNYS